MTRIVLLSALLFASGACSKKQDREGGSQSGEVAAAKPAPLEYKPIPWMGLKVEVPGNADISDTSADAPNASIYAKGCSVVVSTVTVAFPSTFEAAVARAEKGLGN